jgi:hypothetical protein
MSLNSKSKIELIDAICEGPIEGLVDASRKAVFLNETIVTGSQKNDEKVIFKQRQGNQKQDLFSESSTLSAAQTVVINVGEQVGKSYSEKLTTDGTNTVAKRDYGKGQVARQLSDENIDFVELIFRVPRLFCIASEGVARGQLFSASLKFQISIAGPDTGYKHILLSNNDNIQNADQANILTGISNSPYQFKTQRIDLASVTGSKVGPYRIRVRKLEFGKTSQEREEAFEISFRDFKDTPKKTPIASKRKDELIWDQIIIGTKLKATYPNTALVYMAIDAEEYSTLPARAYDVKGLRVKIPSNSYVATDGSGRLIIDPNVPFDGSLREDELHWTTCPVCCFYDLLTNSRYGAGDFIEESNLNWVDLIEIAKYCNDEVDTPDGKEARFAINTVIGTQTEAYNVLQDMASIFRGMLFWKADNVQIAADHGGVSSNVLHVYSNSNVVDGSFTYNGSSLKSRSTRIKVRYNDPENFYKPNYICVEDRDLIKKYGVQEKSIVAFGCTSKYQAQRMGKWMMQSEKLHNDTVTFSVGLEGLNVLPGQVFEVSDEMRLGTRIAGRIVGALVDRVVADQTVVLPPGANNKVSVVMKDGTIETSSISSVINNNTILVSPSFTQVPPDNAIYAIKNDTAKLLKYRCLSVAEGDGGVYTIVGVRHDEALYDVVESSDATLTLEQPFSLIGKPLAAVEPLITFEQIDVGRNTTNRATVSWSRGLAKYASRFKVSYRVGPNGNTRAAFTDNTFIDIDDKLEPGKVLFVEVQAVGLAPDFKLSDAVAVSREIPEPGTSDPSGGITTDPNDNDNPIKIESVLRPPDPEDVTIEAIGVDQVALRWGATASGQKLEGFVAVIKHSSKTDGSGSWANSSVLRKVEARTTTVVLPLLNGEYLIKFQNEQNLRSLNAVSAIINIPDGIPRLNFEVFREDQLANEFGGDKVGVFYKQEYDGLILDGDASFDAISNFDTFRAGPDILASEIVAGKVYTILAAGTTDFTAVGAANNNTGTIFTATGSATGSGTLYAFIDSHFGTQLTKGEYFFQKTVDLGGKYSVRMQRVLTTRGLYASDLIDDRTENVDTWSDFDGLVPDDTNVEVYFRKNIDTQNSLTPAGLTGDIVQEDGSKIEQEDDVSAFKREAVLEFEDWIPLENNVYVGRFFQFKAVLTTDHVDQTPIVDQLGVTLQFERRTESSKKIASGQTSKSETFEKAFYTDADTEVAVGITAFDMNSGDYYRLTNVTGTGFTITFYNSSNTVIDKEFQYTAIGYGTQQS